MGGKWRTPTVEQLKELLKNTNIKIIYINIQRCIEFTSKQNNKKLIIPFSKYYDAYNNSIRNTECDVNIWSSMISNIDKECGNILYCHYSINDDEYDFGVSSSLRHNAFSVRGVFKK